MADQPTFMSGLMAGLNGLGSNPLFNIGAGLMSAGSHPFGDVGASLMQANQATAPNQMAQQTQAMAKLQFQKQMQQQDLVSKLLPQLMPGMGGAAAPGGAPQGGAAPPGIAAPDPNAAPGAPPLGLAGMMAPAGGGAVGPAQPGIPAAPPASPPSGGIGGLDPTAALNLGTIGALVGMPGADALSKYPENLTKVQEALQARQKMSAQGPLAMFDTISTANNAAKIINSNMTLKQHWNQVAPQMGLDPQKDLNDENAREYGAFAYNQLAGPAGVPPKTMPHQQQSIRLPDGRLAQVDPVSGKMEISSAGPDVVSAEDRFKNAQEMQRMEMEKEKFSAEQARVGVPTGYEKDPDNPGQLRFIQGGPADPMSAGGGLGARNEVMFQRVTSSANAAARAMENISKLPISASTGWLGGYTPGTGILGATKGVLAGKMTSQDVQDYSTMLAGVSRNLATVETAGLSPGGSLTHSLDSLTLKEGDSQMSKLRKMAEMRQIVEENLSPQLANPKLPPSQKELVKGIIARLQGAIPWTQDDITQLQQSKNPKTTINDYAKQSGLNTSSASPSTGTSASTVARPSVNPKGWQLHQDAKGNYAYVSPDGKSFDPVK